MSVIVLGAKLPPPADAAPIAGCGPLRRLLRLLLYHHLLIVVSLLSEHQLPGRLLQCDHQMLYLARVFHLFVEVEQIGIVFEDTGYRYRMDGEYF
jgi:hypothetical protein